MTLLILALIRWYRPAFSSLRSALALQGECRFWPSCSHYAEESIRTWGLMKGLSLSIKRILRCHPLGSRGVDPVPARASSHVR